MQNSKGVLVRLEAMENSIENLISRSFFLGFQFFEILESYNSKQIVHEKEDIYPLLSLIFLLQVAGYGQIALPKSGPAISSYTILATPVVSTNKTTTTWNFSNTTVVGFAAGLNIFHGKKVGFNLDFEPFITFSASGSKVTNFVFDPGAVFRIGHGFSITTRAAFETSGRYVESTVLAKLFSPGKKNGLVAAVGVPKRFGNNLPVSIGITLFLGVAFL